MFSTRSKSLLLASAGLLACTGANGADIDLFAGVPASGAGAPNVVFVMDTGASFNASNPIFRCSITSAGVVKTDGTGTAPTALDSKNGGVEQCALYTVVAALSVATTKFNVGVMFFNNGQFPYDPLTNTWSSTACSGGVGGCLAMPIVPLNATTKPRILEWIRLWEQNPVGDPGKIRGIQAPASRGDGATMQETWAYYFGKTGVSGKSYASTMPAATGCASSHVIWIGNNYAQQASPKDGTNAAASPATRLNGTSVAAQAANPVATAAQKASVVDTISASCTASSAAFAQAVETAENKGAYMLNWAGYMKAQGIATTAIAVQGPSCDTTYAAMMEKMVSAELGGGKFYKTSNFSELVDAFNTALGEIQTVNSAFAAVSLPVSVNTQGSFLNQVYVGMFRPAESFNPRWHGNLKQYKLGRSGTGLQLQDADSKSAINSTTGFLTGCARSYWTPNASDAYWTGNAGRTDCLIDTVVATNSNYPDGNIVEKGAQGYKLRAITPANRVVKTCSATFAGCTAMTDFATSNAAIALDANLVNWARGTNTQGELNLTTAAMRASVHGDVVHSRPVAVNHGASDASPSIVVYYGGNDGMLRAVNGNRGCTTATATGLCAPDDTVGAITSGGTTYTAGQEMWAFMAPEFYGKIKRLYDDEPPISYPASTVSDAREKDYGFDGPITAFKGAANSYVYATMRRGGRAVYAFDVTTPASPALLWKKGCPNATGTTDCSTGYSGIGQTWSSLKTLYAAGYGSGNSPMMITGGGYDGCEDTTVGASNNHTCVAGSIMGNKVFVLDAVTGAVVKAFDTDRSVIADSTIVRDPATGKAIYAYTADLGGNVYRMTFGNGAPASWTITKIASLGCNTPTACDSNRKFMFAPSVVTLDNVTYSLLLGSGDREKPVKDYVASYAVVNFFFMLQDKPSDSAWLSSESATCSANVLCKSSLLGITAGSPPADLGGKKGWYLGLAPHEQVVTSALTLYGTTTFSTHTPQVPVAGSCTNQLGTTYVYNLSYLNAASRNGGDKPFERVSGDGLPPSPTGGTVVLDDGSVQPFCIGCSPDSPLEGESPHEGSGSNPPKSRLYWFNKK